MKFLKVLFVLILCFPCFGQDYIFNRITNVEMNQDIVKYLTERINIIKSIDGQTRIYIPIKKRFLSNTKGKFVKGYFVQYQKLTYRDRKEFYFSPATVYKVFDFKKDKITTEKANNDNKDFFKPKEVKQ